MIHRKSILFLLAFLSCSYLFSQDIVYARKMLNTLTSKNFWGRGYTKNGMHKTGIFLKREFGRLGLQPINNGSFLQPFNYAVNTFPGKMRVSVNGKKLMAGKDFIISPESGALKAAGKLVPIDSAHFIDPQTKLVIELSNKLTWSVAPQPATLTKVIIKDASHIDTPLTYSVQIKNKHVPAFNAANVAGLVKGTLRPDSFIVFTAHYDHLGGMGKNTYFPGANDNASGVSLLLNLAKYYAKNPLPYSVAFICFAGEEAGLKGSKFFTENPLLALKNIRFLVNVDLVGTGEDGITVVNATMFPKEFALLKRVNERSSLVNNIFPRGKAANSDHYWFAEKGVPSFFIYTLGGIAAYHDVNDKAATLPLTEYEDLFRLITAFNKALLD